MSEGFALERPDDAEYAISETDVHDLRRAQLATSLLAGLTADVATPAGISADNTAAVADLVSADLNRILGRVQRLPTP